MAEQDTEQQYDGDVAYTKLVSKVKRGTGTRDQDTVKVVTRHPDPKLAVRQHRYAVEAQRELAQDAREIQPESTHED